MDGRRKLAVLVSVAEDRGELRLSLDDVELTGMGPATWRKSAHYTSKAISEDDLKDLNISEKELAEFGYYILARLSAFRETGAS